MSYTALYRKYRPALFKDVLGQEHIVRTLKNQLISGKVSHAYLFCGTRGTGKTSLAKIFAKAINCISPKDGEPCGICEMCAEIAGERSLNVIEIDAASNNGVDNIRDIREEVRYTPTSGTFKVYIIDEVHMLSAGAYNALLKTLEEPPSHVIFILATTDPQKIPPTIHSRCQRYDFKRIPSVLIAERLSEYLGLEGVRADESALNYIARASDGSMRDALSLLDRIVSFFDGEEITLKKALEVTGSIDSKSFFELTERLNELDARGALLIIDEAAKNGKDVSQIILEALSHFRSVIIAKTTDNPSQLLDISEEMAKELKVKSEKMDVMRVMSYITAFSELQANARYSPNQRVLLEIAVIKLCNPEIINNSYEELYNKVSALEKKLGDGSFMPKDSVKAVEAPGKISKEKKPKMKKVTLPEDLKKVKENFAEILAKLSEDRGNLFFAAILERAEIGFLDDGIVYFIFEDETNENILKGDPNKQEKLLKAIDDTLGITVNIKTIIREQFEKLSGGIEFTNDNIKDGERLLKSAKDAFGDILEDE